jgi:hypothetical protein
LKLVESLEDGLRWKVINAAPPKTVLEIHNQVIEYISLKIWSKE